jgi:general secretion pathway protein L
MHLIAADLGSYSVKIIHSKLERSRVRHLSMHEFILSDYHQEDVVIHNQEELKFKILKDYLADIQDEYKLLIQAPHHCVSMRVLNLPVKSKKKAYQMVPFQLEEQIPYSLSEIQYSAQLEVGKKTTTAQVSFIKKAEFEELFQKLKEFKLTPQIQTTESSLFSIMAKRADMDLSQSFCVLDMGHESTRSYFFRNGELISHHICFVGGKNINEEIAENYNISLDEAIIYKHQNAFVLTEDQYGSADETQKHFGKLMERIFSPLIADFKRWELGYKVAHGTPIHEIYLTGGSSNIKNMENFITEKFGIKSFKLDTFRNVIADKMDTDPKIKVRYNIANLLSQGYLKKQSLSNFLTGDYALAGQVDLPLHSFGFYLVRVAAVSLVFIVSLLTEKFLLYRDIKKIDTRLTNIVKNPELKIAPADKRAVTKLPAKVLSTLSRMDRFIKQEITTLQSAIEINGISPLFKLANILQDSKVNLDQFDSTNNEDFRAILKAENLEDLKKMEMNLNSSFPDANITLDEAKLSLVVSMGAE